MNRHPYLRAYMAGIAVPSVGLLVALTVFIVARLVFSIPIPIERVIIFPMALVPNAFGVWNILYLRSGPHHRWPIGFHGAVLPLVLVGLGGIFAAWGGFLTFGDSGVTLFDTVHVHYSLAALWFPVAAVVYYLLWKYLVGFLNRELGIA